MLRCFNLSRWFVTIGSSGEVKSGAFEIIFYSSVSVTQNKLIALHNCSGWTLLSASDIISDEVKIASYKMKQQRMSLQSM